MVPKKQQKVNRVAYIILILFKSVADVSLFGAFALFYTALTYWVVSLVPDIPFLIAVMWAISFIYILFGILPKYLWSKK